MILMLFVNLVCSFWDTGIPTTCYVSIRPATQPRARLLHPPKVGSQHVPPPASSYVTVAATITVTGNVPSYGSTNQPSQDSAVASQYPPQNADNLITNRSTIDTA